MRLAAPRKRKTAGDIVNQQSKRLALLFDQLDELGAQLRVRQRLTALDNQIALPRDRRSAQLPPSMAIRVRKAHQRRARHLEIFQNAMVHQSYAVRPHALIVIFVVAQQIRLAQLAHRRVVHDAQKRRQNLLPHFFREGLPFRDVLLPVAFRAMAKHFMEKHRGGAPGQQRGTHRRLVDGCGLQPFQLLAHGGFRGIHRLVVRRVRGLHPIKIVVAVQVHAVRRLALYKQLQPVANLPELQLRSFAGHVIGVLRLRRKRHDGIDHRGRIAKRLGVRAHFFFPRFAVQRERIFRPDISMWLLVRKIRRAALRRFDLDFFARFDLDQRFRRGLILLVGLQPDGPPQNLLIIIDWHRRARPAVLRLPLADFVGVVQVIASRAHGNFQPAVAVLAAGKQCTVRAGNIRALRVRDRIADVVRRWVLYVQRLERAVQLRLHHRQQGRALRLRIRRHGLGRRALHPRGGKHQEHRSSRETNASTGK